MKGKRLVLGIGNDILMDDGVGPRVVRKLEESFPLEGVEYSNITLGGLDIVEYINGYEAVVFVDAIKTRGGVPGDVYEFTPADFKETLHLTNLHDISFLTALELGKQLDFDIPKDVYIFAVEIIEDQVFGNDFTPPVNERFPGVVEEIQQRIGELWGR